MDGRAIAPMPIKGDPSLMRFADGTAIPPETVDDDVKLAIPILLNDVKTKCGSKPQAATDGRRPYDVGDPTDQPAHAMVPSPTCWVCVGACASVQMSCAVGPQLAMPHMWRAQLGRVRRR
jgi:hypothetical protein